VVQPISVVTVLFLPFHQCESARPFDHAHLNLMTSPKWVARPTLQGHFMIFGDMLSHMNTWGDATVLTNYALMMTTSELAKPAAATNNEKIKVISHRCNLFRRLHCAVISRSSNIWCTRLNRVVGNLVRTLLLQLRKYRRLAFREWRHLFKNCRLYKHDTYN